MEAYNATLGRAFIGGFRPRFLLLAFGRRGENPHWARPNGSFANVPDGERIFDFKLPRRYLVFAGWAIAHTSKNSKKIASSPDRGPGIIGYFSEWLEMRWH